MYRCNTVTVAELDQLRRLPADNIIRLGRVKAIEADRIVLDEGEVPTTPGTVHVDCTADGLATRPIVPVFDGAQVTLQTVRHCQQVFSAAFIGHVEAAYPDDDAAKNELCTVVPHPDTHMDWLTTQLAALANMARWNQDPALVDWMMSARLDGFTSHDAAAQADPDAQRARMTAAMLAAGKLQSYLQDSPKT